MSKYNPQIAAALSYTASSEGWWICWWCGERPADGRWEGDHIAPIMRADSPLAAACRRCNRRRQAKLPRMETLQRLFWDERVLHTCATGEDLRGYMEQSAVNIFGSVTWIPLLIAATDGKKRILHPDGRVAKLENIKLSKVYGSIPNP